MSGFARRLAYLRGIIAKESAEAGDQGLKLLEEYLEHLAIDHGYHHDRGSIGRYTNWLRRRGPLNDELLDRCDTYAQIRNCLAHSYGLQTSPSLAAEIVDFLGLLIRQETATAAQMMTNQVRTIRADDLLRTARDTMLRERFARLPVLDVTGHVTALLVERDIVAAQAQAEQQNADTDQATVADILPKQARRRLRLIAPDAPYDTVIETLRRPGIEALIVTNRGRRDQKPLGIITHADVLYRL
jgi:CBS domain-containing protein